MKLTFYGALLPLALWLPACSFVESDEPELSLLWQTGEHVSYLTVNRSGSLDADRFYAERERVSGGGALTAYDRRTGAVAWLQTVSPGCTAVPVGTRVFCAGHFLYALDAETGRQLWRAGTGATDSSFSLVTAAADADRVYVGVAGAPDGSGRIAAFDAATGARLWGRTFEGPGWKGVHVESLALSPEGELLVAFTGEYDPPSIYSAAVVAAVDPATGRELWRSVDGDATTNREISDLAFWGPLVLYSDVGGSGREVVAFDRRTRAVAWRAPVTPTGGASLFPQAPTVVGDRVYYTDTFGGVFAVEARTGAPVWTAQGAGGFFNQLACGGVLYVDEQYGSLFRLSDGRPLGRLFEDEDTIPSQAAVADGVLYVSASTGVYAFDCDP